jgi:uncharacterized membrane protein
VNDPAVFVPTLLGLSFLTAGILNYRRDLLSATSSGLLSLTVLGPVFIAASLAAFVGEHFTAAASLSELVPKWMPARLFLTYFVGVAHLAAALSLVAKRCIRWSAIGLASMFALFVLLLYLPSAVKHPSVRMVWIFPVREGTFAMGGVALFATAVRDQWRGISDRLAGVPRIWTGLALIFFGIQNVLYPQFAPGVPDNVPTSPWLPFPLTIAYVIGALLIVFGVAALVRKWSGLAISSAGLLMALLTLCLYAPDFFLARNVSAQVTAINFIFDTLLFGGTLFVIANAQNSSNIVL